MKKRDVIIVSVLINAGLLIILFASAIKTPAPTEVVHARKSEEVVVPQAPAAPPSSDTPLQLAPQDFPVVTAAPPSPVIAPPTVIPLPELPAPEPVAAIVPQAAPSEQFTEIKVKKGDALDKIARRHHVSVAKIMDCNHLTSTNLRIGQLLKIPSASMAASPLVEPSPVSAKYHTVKPGDTPWAIAMQYHIALDELLKLNHLNAEKARRLKPGDQLRVQ